MELNEVTGWLGLKATTLDELKKEFPTKYKTEQQLLDDETFISKATGRITDKIKNNVIGMARAEDIEFTRKELEEMKIEDVFKHMVEKQAGSFTQKITELEALASKNSDETVKTLQSQLEKAEKKIRDTDLGWKATAAEYENHKKESENKIKTVKLDYVKEKEWGNVKYPPGVPELQIIGFKSKVESKYKLDLDEKGMDIATDMNGNRIPNPQKHGEFYSYGDLIKLEQAAEKMDVKNDQAGRPVYNRTQEQPARFEAAPVSKSSAKINPRFGV